MAEKKEENKEKKPLNINLILGVVLAVLNLGVCGYGLYLTYAATLGWHPPMITEQDLAKEEEHKKSSEDDFGPLIYTMDKFTVNLTGEPKRSIRIEVNLEMLGKDGFEEVIDTENRAKVRDRILKILNEKTFSEVESIQGKLFLKEKIAQEINSTLKEGVVKDVYFSEFVVQ